MKPILMMISKNHFNIVIYENFIDVMEKPLRTIFVDPNKTNIVMKMDECEYEYVNFVSGEKTKFYKILFEGNLFWAHWVYFERI
jgi:hypothetical protein